MINIILESASGERGYILLYRKSKLSIEVSSTEDKGTELVKDKYNFKNLPQSIILTCLKTKNWITISNAKKDTKYKFDEYIKKSNVKSILCAPIIKMEKVVGIIYLENNTIEGVFTSQKREILTHVSYFEISKWKND